MREQWQSLSDEEAVVLVRAGETQLFELLDRFVGEAAFSTVATKIAWYEACGRVRKGERLSALENDEGEIVAEARRVMTDADDPEKLAMCN